MSDAPQRLIYTPRPDATPESELSALAAVYRFCLFESNAGKKAAEGSGGKVARKGSMDHRTRKFYTHELEDTLVGLRELLARHPALTYCGPEELAQQLRESGYLRRQPEVHEVEAALEALRIEGEVQP